jgi:hypothetical protein
MITETELFYLVMLILLMLIIHLVLMTGHRRQGFPPPQILLRRRCTKEANTRRSYRISSINVLNYACQKRSQPISRRIMRHQDPLPLTM